MLLLGRETWPSASKNIFIKQHSHTVFDDYCMKVMAPTYRHHFKSNSSRTLTDINSKLVVYPYLYFLYRDCSAHFSACAIFITHSYVVTYPLCCRRDQSAGYCYSKRKKEGSQEFVDHWIPYERPPVSFAEQHTLRAQQV